MDTTRYVALDAYIDGVVTPSLERESYTVDDARAIARATSEYRDGAFYQNVSTDEFWVIVERVLEGK